MIKKSTPKSKNHSKCCDPQIAVLHRTIRTSLGLPTPNSETYDGSTNGSSSSINRTFPTRCQQGETGKHLKTRRTLQSAVRFHFPKKNQTYTRAPQKIMKRRKKLRLHCCCQKQTQLTGAVPMNFGINNYLFSSDQSVNVFSGPLI